MGGMSPASDGELAWYCVILVLLVIIAVAKVLTWIGLTQWAVYILSTSFFMPVVLVTFVVSYVVIVVTGINKTKEEKDKTDQESVSASPSYDI
jgi:hypothetical protein